MAIPKFYLKRSLLFLFISSMHAENPIEVSLLNIQRFIFGPFINTHFFDEAKIEKFGIVGPFT